jgi:thymidylate kinase
MLRPFPTRNGSGLLTNVVVSDDPARVSPLPLVRELTDALETESVGYCHWKSNAFLDRSRTGQNDLDLLVRRSDVDAFSTLMHRLGFKQATNPMRFLPAIENYYGHDRFSDRIVHVHAHYQLIVGDDLTKNYRIPLEAAFLETTVRDGEFRIPIPELELILLVIRLTLKHSTWAALLLRRARIPASAHGELAFLRARADEKFLETLLTRHLPFVEEDAFREAMGSLDSRAPARIRAGRRLVTQLAVCARRSAVVDVPSKVWRRGLGTARARLPLAPPRRRLAGGGAIIAVVGADGAGKSTCVDSLFSWLAKDFAVAKIHLGRPPRSALTLVVRPLLKVALGLAALRRRVLKTGTMEAPSRSLARALHAVTTARDRYMAYRRARRLASNGTLVLSDRFPLPQLRLMDAPRVDRQMPTSAGPLGRRLASLERRYYRAVVLPDVLVVLRVDPEIAVTRKPDERPDFVRARWREIWEIDWGAIDGHVVDAGRPTPEVVSDVKAFVWSRL